MTIDKDPVDIDDSFYNPTSLYRAALPQDVERFASLMQANDKATSFPQTGEADRPCPSLAQAPSPIHVKQLRQYAGDHSNSVLTHITNIPGSSNVNGDVTATHPDPAPIPSKHVMDRLTEQHIRQSQVAPSAPPGATKEVDQTRQSRVRAINEPVSSALSGKRRFHGDEATSSLSSPATAVLQDGQLPPSIGMPMHFEASAQRHDSSPAEHFAELIARHVQQLLVADLEGSAIRDPRIMLRLKPETVADTDIFLVKQAAGWVVQANTQSHDSHRMLKEGAAALTERFSRRGLGPVTLVVDSEEQSQG